MRQRHWFVLLNLGILASFAAAAYKDYDRDWRRYQKQYYRMTVESLQKKLAEAKDEGERASLQSEVKAWKRKPVEIKQMIVTELGRVDRCVTCHVGMDSFTNPTLENDFTEHPYKAHPDLKGIAAQHNFQQFGCTTCHEGQGLATEAPAAHGDVRFWETQVRKQPFVQGSCVKCHSDFEDLGGAQAAVKGRTLFKELGCVGCHAVNGEGGIISVDLGDVADKPVERIAEADFHRAHMPEEAAKLTVQNWILAHLIKDPQDFVRNDPEGHYNAEPIAPSGMPPFYERLSREDAEALTTYLLSFTKQRIPKEYYVFKASKPEPKPASAVGRGQLVYRKFGCAGCHGAAGSAGTRNFNAVGPGQDAEKPWDFHEMSKGRCSTLADLIGTYSVPELKEKIRTGVPVTAITKFNAAGPTPPLYMPPWGEKIKGQELDDLVAYLFSIAKSSGEEW